MELPKEKNDRKKYGTPFQWPSHAPSIFKPTNK